MAKRGAPHPEFYLALLYLSLAFLGALTLLLGALKALNGTEDEESVFFHSLMIMIFMFLVSIFFYANVKLGIVTLASYLLSLASFAVYLAIVEGESFVTYKENIVVRFPILHEFFTSPRPTSSAINILTIISALIKVLFKGDRKYNVFARYVVISALLVAFSAGAYPILGTLFLFLAGYSVTGYLSLIAVLIAALLTLKSTLFGSTPLLLRLLAELGVQLTPLEYFTFKVAMGSALTALTIYGLRRKIFAWGPGTAILIIPMLSVFFIEKGQDPLGSLAYALGALVSFVLNKRERLEELMDKLVAKLSVFGEKIIRLDVDTIPYLMFLALFTCLYKPVCMKIISLTDFKEGIKACLACYPDEAKAI